MGQIRGNKPVLSSVARTGSYGTRPHCFCVRTVVVVYKLTPVRNDQSSYFDLHMGALKDRLLPGLLAVYREPKWGHRPPSTF